MFIVITIKLPIHIIIFNRINRSCKIILISIIVPLLNFVNSVLILIILSAIIGPFEAMYALNKARRNREAAEKKETGPDEPGRNE